MKLFICVAVIASAAYVAPAGTAQTSLAPQSRNGLIANVDHDGLHFAIRIDAADDRFLAIVIPRETGSYTRSSLPTVPIKVLWHGGSIAEGAAELLPGAIGMGGWDDLRYRFALRKRTVVADIQTVTISIGDQTYTVATF
jgi:hypothetical protein